jgi:hypothetical protein
MDAFNTPSSVAQDVSGSSSIAFFALNAFPLEFVAFIEAVFARSMAKASSKYCFSSVNLLISLYLLQ